MKKIVNAEEWLSQHKANEVTGNRLYAMYSSVIDGIVTDPALMLVPIDDHVVHRGDGIFESFKCINGSIYNLYDHLERLKKSCTKIGIDLPCSLEEMESITVQTVRAGNQTNALVRLIVSRGRGTMGVNPYACLKPELYIVVYENKSAISETLSKGVRVATSCIPMKPGIFATVKTCNYLPNVLMKKEAIDLGVDFTISFDEQGNLGEGATENVGIVTVNKELLMPPPERVLAGTTAKRALTLAQNLVDSGQLTCAEFRPVSKEQCKDAAEIHIYGTTPNVTPVLEFDGKSVGNGTVGPIAQTLSKLLKADMDPSGQRLTKVFE